MARRDGPSDPDLFRPVEVPEQGAGMRLDRFLSARFVELSRTLIARAIGDGLVTDDTGRALRKSARVDAGQILRLYMPEVAPTEPPPSLPPVLYEDDRVVVLDKPPGLACHPGGTRFVWAVVGLARERWPDADLAHRLDRDTSGALVLTKDVEANAFLKQAFREGAADKQYQALCRGRIAWDHKVIAAPIGDADGPIRIQRGVTPDGLPAKTEVWVEDRAETMTRVRIRLHTGRTHQIRVHLAHVGHSLVGDRMYGVPPDVFLHYWEHGLDERVIAGAGAPRHALHAASISFAHPDGGEVMVHAPFPADLARWWAHPEVLPLDEPAGEDVPMLESGDSRNEVDR